jgi:hypothetical protein
MERIRTFAVTQAFAPVLAKNSGGAIANLNSVADARGRSDEDCLTWGFRRGVGIPDPKGGRSCRALRTSSKICRTMSISGKLVRRPNETPKGRL